MIIDNTYQIFQSKFIRNFARHEIIRLLFIESGKRPNDCAACRYGVPVNKRHYASPGNKRECLLELPKPRRYQARDCQGFIPWNPIRVIREREGLSRRDLADNINRHIKTVTLYELNRRIPGIGMLEMFAKGLNVPPALLFELYQLGSLSARRDK